jgi:hypothetical protein
VRKKKAKLTITIAAIIAVATVGGLYYYYRRDNRAGTDVVSADAPQCAHWSIMRCCQLHGVPIPMGTLMDKLPYSTKGHNLYEVKALLEDIGFETEALRCDYQTLLSKHLPCIVQLRDPDHYVVVSGIDEDYIHLFDGDGLRTARDKRRFLERWSGVALFVSVPSGKARLPRYMPTPAEGAPQIKFRQLLLDPGTIPATGRPTLYEYPFENVGTQPLVIEDVDPDCACIRCEKPDSPFAPGESGAIRLHYNVEATRGPFSHNVVVRTNDPQVPVAVLVASGWTGIEFKVNPQLAGLTDPVDGHPVTARFFVRYTGDKTDLEVGVDRLVFSNATVVDHSFTPVTEAHAERLFPGFGEARRGYRKCYVLEITVVPNGTPGTSIEGTAELKTNVEDYESFDLKVVGEIRESVQAHPSVIDFSGLEAKEVRERTVLVRSTAGEPFSITRITMPAEYLTCEYDGNRSASEVELAFESRPPVDDQAAEADNRDIVLHIRLESGKELDLPVKVLER